MGLYGTGNDMDIDSEEHFRSMSLYERQKRMAAARRKLVATGAHYIVPDITYLPSIVGDINKRLSRGDRP